jgi:hypothetical protein
MPETYMTLVNRPFLRELMRGWTNMPEGHYEDELQAFLSRWHIDVWPTGQPPQPILPANTGTIEEKFLAELDALLEGAYGQGYSDARTDLGCEP